MRSLDNWMSAYGESHKNKTNILIHKVCVPLIVFSVFGILWSIPFPIELAPLINWATVLFGISCIFYATLGLKVLIFMLLQGSVILYLVYLCSFGQYLMQISISIFVLSWIAQFIGHKIEGKKPSFLQDIQFLLIGPLWIYPFFK